MTPDMFEIGNYVRRWGNFVDDDGKPADPTFIVAYVTNPSGQTTQSTLMGGGVLRAKVGAYYWHIIASVPGRYAIRWVCSDAHIHSVTPPDAFEVESSVIYDEHG